MFSYTQGDAPDVFVPTNGGGFKRSGHVRPEAEVEYGCARCEKVYAHETYMMNESEKAKYTWAPDAEGAPAS